ncbi:MAG: hypothetical protein E7331_10220 [Clostridiales bacterium]|nr:hypothetical protein [Clostridiales bacterium]
MVGNYGSGKTELSIALARKMRKSVSGRVALVDLDIVNPYFRSAEQKQLLEQEGIEVFMPSFAMSTVDIPALPAQIYGVFQQDFERVIFDVGGDDTGATALGPYAPHFARVREQTQVLYVVNAFRPFSDSADKIEDLYRLIGEKSRLIPDGFINNGNLQEHTVAADLVEAHQVVDEASRRLAVPIVAVSGKPSLKEELPRDMQAIFFPFDPVMKPEWLVNIDE